MVMKSKTIQTVSIAVCDDDEELLRQMEMVLRQVSESSDIKLYSSAERLLKEVSCRNGQGGISAHWVIFSDIEMPEMNGIELGKRLREVCPDSVLIFTTSHPEYAIHGYEARAFRYLLKPVSAETVQRVLTDVQKEWNRHRKQILQMEDTGRQLDLDDILYMSAEDKYTMLYTQQERLIDRTSLQELEGMLENCGFYRIHRKYLVNLRYHRSMSKGMLQLSNGQELPVSRRRETGYRETLRKWMERELL